MKARKQMTNLYAIRKLAVSNNIPLDCAFELTARCNFDCKMCYVHEPDSPEIRAKELSTKQWISVFNQAIDAGMMIATLTGGECLLRKDFKELYLYLWDKTKLIINTNASLINDDLLHFFIQNPPFMIQISLYGSNDEIYQKVTGRPLYKKVIETIDALIKNNIPVKLALTISKYNFLNLQEMIHFAKERNVEVSTTAELIAPREGISRDDYMLSKDEYLEYLNIKQIALKGKQAVKPSYPTPRPGRPADCTLSTDEPFVRCKAGRGGAFISWKGEMLACATITDFHVNILSEGFANAWKKINAFVLNAKMPVECVGCPYDKYCNKCPAIRAEHLYAGQCKASCCEATMARYNNGDFRLSVSEIQE